MDNTALRSSLKHPVTVNEVIASQIVEVYNADITEPVTTYSIPLPNSKLRELQESDEKLC